MINGFLLAKDEQEFLQRKGDANEWYVATNSVDALSKIKGVKAFAYVEKKEDLKGDKICLSSLNLDDDVLDACIEYVLSNKCEFMVRACENLTESGLLESKYHLSPIMILHKMGLLEGAIVVGANHIDRDDLDLMIQCNAKIVLLPSYSMGKGNGFAPISFTKGKIPLLFGTVDNSYNEEGSIKMEGYLARLSGNCEARKEDAVTEQEILKICKGLQND